MKKVINGRRYDTDTAKELASESYSNCRDFHYWAETLYRKNTGEYFLHGVGGPASKYSQAVGLNEWSGGERIMPMTPDEAKEWAEKYLDADKYEEIFGQIEEETEKKTVSFSLRLQTIEKIKTEAAKRGIPMSEYIDSIINA